MTPDKEDDRLTTVPVVTTTVTATRDVPVGGPLAGERREVEDAGPLHPGDRLCSGRFEILRRLGSGGMGVVYAALDHTHGTHVALKTLTHAGAADIYRLKNEFRALSDVVHPNLVTLHELFQDGARWLFSMELVNGVPFNEWVRPAGQLDEGRLLAALPQLVSAIDTIHTAGQLHRDLKPSNVLVTDGGHILVLDLGLTVPREPGGVGRTLEHEGIIGTPAYMAPEQVVEDVATTASDYYALGVMLFEALTNSLPFSGSVGSVLMAKQVRSAPNTLSLAPGAPADLALLADALLARDPRQRPDAARLRAQWGPPPSLTPVSASLPPASTTELLGRDQELARLLAAFQQSMAGSLSLVFVEGKSGMGKSTLIDAATRRLEASHGAILLIGRCYEREAVPFKAFDSLVDALSRYLRRLSAPDAAALLPRDVRTLAQIFPVLERVTAVADAPMRTFDTVQEQRERAFAAFGELLGRIRDRRPLVVHIDDMQWCDAESALFLRHLLDKHDLPPLTLVFSYRSDGTDAPALAEVRKAAQGARDAVVTHLALGPISLAASRNLALALLQDVEGTNHDADHDPDHDAEQAVDHDPGHHTRAALTALADRIAREAEGSPLFVGELARYVNAHRADEVGSLGTLTLPRALHARIEQLPAPARRLLEVVSVSARPLPLTVARQAAGLGPNDTLAKEQLRAALFVRVTGGDDPQSLEVYHDRVRETVQDALSPDHLREVHTHLAAALQASDAADPEALAYHLDGAGQPEAAAMAALAAARRAMDVLAFERAARLLRRARAYETFDTLQRQEIALALASALSSAGRGPEAAEAYLEASRIVVDRAVELRLLAARQLSTTGYLERGLGLVEELLTEHGLRPDEPSASMTHHLDRFWLRMRGLDVRPRALSDMGPEALLHMELSALCQSGFILVDQSRAAEYAMRTLKLALEHGHAPRAVRMIAVLATLEANSGHDKRAEKLIERAERMLHTKVIDSHLYGEDEIGATRVEVEQEAGVTAMFMGDFETSVRRLDAALSMHRQGTHRRQFMITACESFRCWSLFHLGRFADMRASIVPQLEASGQRGDLLSAATLAGATGVFAFLHVDDANGARTRLEWAKARWPGERYDLQRCFLLLGLTWVDFYEHHHGRAWLRWASAWEGFSTSPVVRMSHTMRTYGTLTYGLAAACAIEHVAPEERDRLRRIVERCARELEHLDAFPPARGHALSLSGIAALARHDPKQAQASLAEALQFYRDQGYPFYAAATEYRLAQLVGGEPGELSTNSAQELLSRAGVARPVGIFDTLLPVP